MRTLTQSLVAGAMGALLVTALLGATNQLITPSSPLVLRSDGIQFPDGTVQTTAAPGDTRRAFYLTSSAYDGALASLACASGYHMASLWEIHDVSNLRYATEMGSLAVTYGDSGDGPPASARGWVRTGYWSWTADREGIANCSGWSSRSQGDYGTTVMLLQIWDSPSSVLDPWWPGTAQCVYGRSVWCVES